MKAPMVSVFEANIPIPLCLRHKFEVTVSRDSSEEDLIAMLSEIL